MPANVEPQTSEGAGLAALWISILGPPIVWWANLEISFAVVPWACMYSIEWLLHAITAVALALAAASGYAGWRKWSEIRAVSGDAAGRARFMAIVGIMTSAMFFLVILAQGLTSFILGACQ